jgi:serine/threonine protein kinase
MGNTLKEKAELENYLAQISNELNVDKALSSNALEGDLTLGRITVKNPPPGSDADATLVANVGDGNVTSNAGRPTIAVGTMIGDRYDVLELIGQGAMGLVFLVQDRELDEKTALKLLPRDLFTVNTDISIKEEIRLARRITHSNILSESLAAEASFTT